MIFQISLKDIREIVIKMKSTIKKNNNQYFTTKFLNLARINFYLYQADKHTLSDEVGKNKEKIVGKSNAHHLWKSYFEHQKAVKTYKLNRPVVVTSKIFSVPVFQISTDRSARKSDSS